MRLIGRPSLPDVIKAGGFDAVIGNPPYVRQELLGDWKSYFQEHYRTYHGVADLYVYFIEKGISLLRDNGYFGIIVANKWIRSNYGKPLRQWLKQQHITEITDFGDLPVFQPATTYPCILGIQKSKPQTTFQVTQVKTLEFADLKTYTAENSYAVQQTPLDDAGWTLIGKNTQALLDKLHQMGVPLSEYINGKIYRGVLTGLNEAFVIDAATRDKLIAEDANGEKLIKPFLLGRDIKRYQPLVVQRYLIFTRRGVEIQQYPAIEQHLLQFKKQLMPKPKDWKGEKWLGRKSGSYEWYEIQDTVAYYEEFEKPKIIYPNICKKPEFVFEETSYYTNQKCFIIPVSDKYLLGILNSSITMFLFRSILPKLRGGFLRTKLCLF